MPFQLPVVNPSTIRFQCVYIKKTKESTTYNQYLDKPTLKDFWIVKFECPVLKIRWAFSFEQEIEARKFSEGKSYTPAELIAIVFG